MIFHEYLTTRKTIEQLVNIAKEHGFNWNEDQVKLYCLLDPFIYETELGQWAVKVDDRRQTILGAIEKALEKRPMTKIDPNIIEQLPNDMIVPHHEVIEVAVSTGRYESPRENIIRVKRK
ncbi:hypothetical protein GLV94_18550 [Virgibacillus halodenitrificans]|uniref:hypothetical protein n=1 Tax=Virgibacillus halodenitrificans TaxID=1482 RepID=UPI00136D3045|nr:hypothetical protein [Virgibacillus halodenitrificans]MYL47643.1 hypothetical protein [Virgibacillus halodenitrificans]